MDVAFWNDLSREHKNKYYALKKLDVGCCLECRRPKRNWHYLCTTCMAKLKNTGLELKRVSFREVGQNVINYQQHLHRAFFGCNVGLDYRGLKENRKKYVIPQEDIDKASVILSRYLSVTTKNAQQKELYLSVKDLRNTNRRLLYSITLYAISYFIEDYKEFKSFAHYQASICRQLDNDIVRMFMRTHKTAKIDKNNTSSRTMKQMKQQFKAIERATLLVLQHLSD